MAELKPVPYDGTDSYIFVSYSHKDNDIVWDMIQEIQNRRYNVWYDEGIHPGTEWDAFIENRLENCSCYISFITENYWESKNCLDELKYAVDLDKNMVLAYLSECEIPSGIGLRMRIGRKQNIHRANFEWDQDFLDRLCLADGMQSSDYQKVSGSEIKKDDIDTILYEKEQPIYDAIVSKKYKTFGRYPQSTDRPEPIEWLVLKKEGTRALLISRYGLDAKPFHIHGYSVFWETCTLRKWLNEDFLNTAFDEKERYRIEYTMCPADRNPQYDTDPGNTTMDKVFLLSIPEVEKYFNSNIESGAAATAYAKKHGVTSDDDVFNSIFFGPCCRWWLRTPSGYPGVATYVRSRGDADWCGEYADSNHIAVRPAIWVNLI